MVTWGTGTQQKLFRDYFSSILHGALVSSGSLAILRDLPPSRPDLVACVTSCRHLSVSSIRFFDLFSSSPCNVLASNFEAEINKFQLEISKFWILFVCAIEGFLNWITAGTRGKE